MNTSLPRLFSGATQRCKPRWFGTRTLEMPPEPKSYTLDRLCEIETNTINEHVSIDTIQDMHDEYAFPMIKYHRDPFLITRGNMQYLYDNKDRRYLDMFGGVVTVGAGHCHPRITAAAMHQMQKLWFTSSLYYTPHVAQFSKELVETFPEGSLLRNEGVVRFVNSGSEANELALLIAQLYTGNYDMILHRNCYFGMSTSTSIAMTSGSPWRYHLPKNPNLLHIAHPNANGIFGDDVDRYLVDLDDAISYSTSGHVAGMFVEPIQGVGGVHPTLKGYLPRAFDRVRIAGGVCIASELQTGFGRTGKTFWGYEQHDVDPDIVVVGKSMGNGYPLAAVITRPEIAEVIKKRVHFNTYAGSPLACTVGLESLRVIKHEKLQQNSRNTGERLLKGIRALQKSYDCIGDVRGEGLLIGMDFVEPGPEGGMMASRAVCNTVFEEAKEKYGILFGKGGPFINVLRIAPPMCITEADVDYTLGALENILRSL